MLRDPQGWAAMSADLAQPPTVEDIVSGYAAGIAEARVWPDRTAAKVLARSQIREWLGALAADMRAAARGQAAGPVLAQLIDYTN